MKKYIISSGIMALALTPALAETQAAVGTRVMVTQGRPAAVTAQMQMVPPTITTGDATTDAKIKALQVEMEAKIKVIRDEYQAKIKALIGDKKVTVTGGAGMEMREGMGHMMMEASSTAGGGRGEARGVMMRQGRTEGRSGEESSSARMENNGGSMRMQVRSQGGEEGDANVEVNVEGGIRGFFGRLFGR